MGIHDRDYMRLEARPRRAASSPGQRPGHAPGWRDRVRFWWWRLWARRKGR